VGEGVGVWWRVVMRRRVGKGDQKLGERDPWWARKREVWRGSYMYVSEERIELLMDTRQRECRIKLLVRVGGGRTCFGGGRRWPFPN
jgi:hypothetical protein